jgi:hypothetical protein
MRGHSLTQRWGLFAATVFVLIGLILANLQAGPVAEHGVILRYAFWMATAAATFLSWWFSQWLVVSGRDRLSRALLVISSFVATLLFVPASLAIDLLFGMPDTDTAWLWMIIEEWLVSALPVFSSCLIASLPAWLSTATPSESIEKPNSKLEQVVDAASGEDSDVPKDSSNEGVDRLLPLVIRGGVLRVTADLQYVHILSPEGVTTVPGPMHRITDRLSEEGMEVRRGEWIADRHVKQAKCVRGRWVILLKDGQQVSVSRRRLADVKNRWGSTRFL